jgi:hypothetical protein
VSAVRREFKPVVRKRGTVIHASCVESMRLTQCGLSCDGWSLLADEVPNCKRCLRAIVAALDET